MEYSFETFKELKDLVVKNGDVLTVTMEGLRDAQGAAKIGKFVITGIQDSLAKQGLKTFPKELPMFQHECVRVYSDGTAVSKLFSAMVEVSNWDYLDENYESDQLIRETVNNEAQDALTQIRQIVCN